MPRWRTTLLACGHGNGVAVNTEAGLCWDCHLADLRAKGEGARADRLASIRRQHDEGRFDPDALLAGLAARLMDQYARGAGPEDRCPEEPRRLRHGRPDWSNRRDSG